jgi:hypothetical protein
MSFFKRFVKERRLVKIGIDRKLVLKEMEGAVRFRRSKGFAVKEKIQMGHYTRVLLDVSCC